jgi:hypothetical protein
MVRKDDRRRRDAERRAQARRESLDRKLRGDLENGAQPLPSESPLRSLADAENAKPRQVRRRPRFVLTTARAALLATGSSVVATVALSLAVTAGTPLFSGKWQAAGALWLIPGALGAYGATLFGSMASKIGKAIAIVVAVSLAASFVAGSTSQVVVDGSAQLRGSVGDRTQRLATALLNDMLVIEENQRLLELPDEQARGVYDLYAVAAAQSADLAAKWNPAVNADVPLPGFVQVLELVNGAADLQSRALIAFADDLNQPDPARKQQVLAMRDQVTALLAAEDGAARLLAQTVEPLGIVLNVENGSAQ